MNEVIAQLYHRKSIRVYTEQEIGQVGTWAKIKSNFHILF